MDGCLKFTFLTRHVLLSPNPSNEVVFCLTFDGLITYKIVLDIVGQSVYLYICIFGIQISQAYVSLFDWLLYKRRL